MRRLRMPALVGAVTLVLSLAACTAQEDANHVVHARPTRLPATALMSAKDSDFELSTGLVVTLPGEFVYPPEVAAAVGPPFPPLGRLEYVDSPDTSDSGPAGSAIEPRGPRCSGRCLEIESLPAPPDLRAYVAGPLRAAITGRDHGTALSAVSLPEASGWRWQAGDELAETLATLRGGTLHLFTLLAPRASFASEVPRLLEVLRSLRPAAG